MLTLVTSCGEIDLGGLATSILNGNGNYTVSDDTGSDNTASDDSSGQYDSDGVPIYGYNNGQAIYGYDASNLPIYDIRLVKPGCKVPPHPRRPPHYKPAFHRPPMRRNAPAPIPPDRGMGKERPHPHAGKPPVQDRNMRGKGPGPGQGAQPRTDRRPPKAANPKPGNANPPAPGSPDKKH